MQYEVEMRKKGETKIPKKSIQKSIRGLLDYFSRVLCKWSTGLTSRRKVGKPKIRILSHLFFIKLMRLVIKLKLD